MKTEILKLLRESEGYVSGQKLCGKLGIGICAQSAENAGTRISLEFPVSSYLSKL